MRPFLSSFTALAAVLSLSLAAPAAYADPVTVSCPYTFICVFQLIGTPDSVANGIDSVALNGQAWADHTVAIGGQAVADSSVALGSGAIANYENSVAIGANTQTAEANTVAVGGRRITQVAAGVNPLDAVNVQQLNTAMDSAGSPIWMATDDPITAATVNSVNGMGIAVGPGSNAAGQAVTALGSHASAGNPSAPGLTGGYDTAVGYGAKAGVNGTFGSSTSLGAAANAAADGSTVLGANSSATSAAVNSVVLGSFTSTDRANTVAIGNRSLSQMQDGTELQDGVTVNQLNNAVAGYGAGASFLGGTFTPPTYNMSAGTYHDVGSALSYLDTSMVTGRQSMQAQFGGGASYNASTGTFVGPTYVLSGGPFGDVGSALTYLDTSMTGGLTSLTTWLGGGASISNGTFYPPTYSLGGNTYHDVGSALTGLQTQITNIDAGAGGGSAPVWMATDAPTVAANQAGFDETAVGPGASAGNTDTGQNTAIGAGASAGTVGSGAAGTGGQATAVGAHAGADALGSSSFGQGAYVGPDGVFSVSVGAQTSTDRANTVAIGNRTLSQMQNGTELQDGVTVNQLNNAVAGYGGGASFLGGTFTPPSYTFISGATYNNVGSALADLDGRVYTLENAPPGTGGTGPAGPQGPAGPTGPQGPKGEDATGVDGTDSMAVHYDSAAKTSVTLGGADANGTAITPAVTLSNVANGAVNATSTQAVNGAQLYQVKQAATAYTDQQVSNVQNWAKSYTDNKFAQARRDSDQAGAAGGAIGMLALSATRVSPEYRQNGNLSISTGAYGNSGAIAMGWSQTYDNGRVGVAVAASWTGDHTFVGGSVSIGLDDLW